MRQFGRQLFKSRADLFKTVTIASGAVTFDLREGLFFDVNLTENITAVTITGAVASGYVHSFFVRFRQTTANAYTVTGYPASVSWPWHGGSAPVIDTAQNSQDYVRFDTWDGGTNYLGLLAGSNNQATRRMRAFTQAAWAANKLPYFSGTEAVALADLTAFARTLLDDPDQSTALATLGAQASDADLTAIAALTGTGHLRRTGTDAWALDTFVAGTFTPTFTFSTPGNLSVSYATQLGHYIRRGDIVHVVYVLVFTPTHSTASGAALFQGLPVTSRNIANLNQALAIGEVQNVTLGANTKAIGVRILANSTEWAFWSIESAATGGRLGAVNFPSGTQFAIHVSGSYLVA